MANNKIVAVDVLPEADVYAVYAALDHAEKQGMIDFEEGHCGHPLKAVRDAHGANAPA
jgi:hypothetical protein